MNEALTLLKKDHDKVKNMLDELLALAPNAKIKRRKLFNELKENLQLHETIEEKLFYPKLKRKKDVHDEIMEAYEEHHMVDVLLHELEEGNIKPDIFKAKLTVLKESLLHHIREEEDEIFPKAEKDLSDQTLNKLAENIETMQQNAQGAK